MRIKKLLIKNLGKHRHLEATLDGSVVGLMGPNGSGKSTILKLIHFLVTGWTPAKETQESFIRKVDPEIEAEPACGSAEMEFYAQGNTYRISRKIGSPSSRKLVKLDAKGKEIKDETYTSAAEIQALLTEILGADKYAIDNAVFPEQGALDKILFGSQAEREELLVKLLLLGHMQKVADVAAGKIKILASEIQDFSTLHDELQATRNSAEVELATAEEQLVRTRSYAAEIKLYEDWERAVNELTSNSSHLLSAKNAARINEDKVAAVLEEQTTKLGVAINSPEELGNWVDKLKNKIKGAHQTVAALQDTKGKAAQYKSIAERIVNYNNDLLLLKADCPAPVDPNLISSLDKKIRDQNLREMYRLEVQEATVKGKETRDRVDRLVEIVKELTEDLKRVEDEEQTLSNERALFKTIVDTCKLALDNNCTADCPVCGESVSHEKLRSRLETYNVKLLEASKKLHDISTSHAQTSKQMRDMQHDLTQRQTLLSLYIKKYKDNKALLDAGTDEDVQVFRDQLTSLNHATAKRASDIKSINKIEFEIKTLEFSIQGYTEEEVKSFHELDITALDKEVTELKDKVEHWSSKLDELSKTYINIQQLISARETEIKRSKEFAAACEGFALKRDAIFDSFPPQLKKLVEQGGETKDTLIENNKLYNQLEAKAAQLKVQANSIRKRLREIEDKIKLDEDKRAVIQELQRVVHAFSRQGIPMAYVQHKFDSLVSMTQDNLEIMDANFAIIPHPSKPVSLQFYRVDEPGQVLFDHDKLSGGQKVRLSIAFLLAVQQLVIPELGFLVLDEPSTHLDEEARENLKELLLNLNQQLESTDTQILVCDHARELEPAFVNVIQL
jgi:exonuclease SbcC